MSSGVYVRYLIAKPTKDNGHRALSRAYPHVDCSSLSETLRNLCDKIDERRLSTSHKRASVASVDRSLSALQMLQIINY